MSLILLDSSAQTQARKGLVRAQGHVVFDGDGIHNFLGCTLFWAPIGFRSERDRILANLDYLASKKVDYIRILCEVDWPGREIDPNWPDYEQVMADTIDEAYARGIRTQPTLIGGRNANHMDVVEKMIRVIVPRQEKILYIECVNEAENLNKADRQIMIQMSRKLKQELPHIVGLSCPLGDWQTWEGTVSQARGDLWIIHTERNEADYHWRQVRQAYDFAAGAWTGSNQEGPGPQSSVGVMDQPLHLAMFRYLSHIAKCGFFTFHVGAGVTGVANPAYGRPANIWESPGIDEQFAALHMIEQFIPDGVQNWKVVNNGREDHPLPLDPRVSSHGSEIIEAGFWQGDARYGSVNKNYAVYHPDGRFVQVLCGVNAWDDKPTLVGVARYRCVVQAFNPLTGEQVDGRSLQMSDKWYLPGRSDKYQAYIVVGRKT